MRTSNTLMAVAVLLMLTENAYAYLDPGTASIALQVVVGAIASGLFVIKLYWAKFKDMIGMNRRDGDDGGNIADASK